MHVVISVHNLWLNSNMCYLSTAAGDQGLLFMQWDNTGTVKPATAPVHAFCKELGQTDNSKRCHPIS